MTTIDLSAPPLEFINLGGYRMAYRQWGSTDATDHNIHRGTFDAFMAAVEPFMTQR